jgi:hypothetical protein
VDRSLTLLLLAIALTWLAWRAARRQTLCAHAMRAAEQERGSCTLEPVETDHGRGFDVVTPDGTRSDGSGLQWAEHGLAVITVDMRSASAEAQLAAEFNAGADVELIPAEDDRTLEVWDRGMSVRAGVVAPLMGAIVLQRAAAGEIGECVVLWEERSGGRRTQLRLLLVHTDLVLEHPQ